MNAGMIRDRLALRWPDGEYLSIYEAPDSSDRTGRKIDVLVAALWRSRGLSLDAVEIKVSVADWKRELERAAKADFWWRHSNRFWVAVPETMAERVQAELPATWGLLSVPVEGKPRVAVQAPHHEAEPLPWGAVLGCLRAAADAGVNALHRARQEGRSQGFKEGQERAASRDGTAEHDALRKRVEAFKEASGIDLGDRYLGERGARDFGATFRLVHEQIRFGTVTDRLQHAGRDITSLAGRLSEEAALFDRLVQIMTPAPESAEETK